MESWREETSGRGAHPTITKWTARGEEKRRVTTTSRSFRASQVSGYSNEWLFKRLTIQANFLISKSYVNCSSLLLTSALSRWVSLEHLIFMLILFRFLPYIVPEHFDLFFIKNIWYCSLVLPIKRRVV